MQEAGFSFSTTKASRWQAFSTTTG
jgi:hypothetical protein